MACPISPSLHSCIVIRASSAKTPMRPLPLQPSSPDGSL
jgi:hypothetical protein